MNDRTGTPINVPAMSGTLRKKSYNAAHLPAAFMRYVAHRRGRTESEHTHDCDGEA
ncbi:MAG TPA: hypothetical protein VJ998_08565 [Pseudomonadales bacterium]|nr:hypothetical protein [Pseudomonadales bacterium]